MEAKLVRLLEYVDKIAHNEATYDVYKEYEQEVLSVSASDLFTLFYAVHQRGSKPSEILVYLDKLIHLFAQALEPKCVDMPVDSFLDHLMQENREMEKRLNAIKAILIEDKYQFIPEHLIERFEELIPFELHYTKLQNILFPYLESKGEQYQGTTILWSLQDQTRKRLKDTIDALKNNLPKQSISEILGDYFFKAFGLIQKEEMILFQVAHEILSVNELEAMRHQSFELGFIWIPMPKPRPQPKFTVDNAFFTTETGSLSFDQLTMVLDALPIDCTYVDENNKVLWFNRPKDRIFPRSPAVIGRDVRNCHPAESVDVVENIIESFRRGEQSEANFWIEMRGKFLYIRYFALRDKDNVYKGVLELSQEVSGIRALEGQRKLLQWDK